MIKEHWSKLGERDQIAILIGSLFLGIYLLYSLIYSPIKNAVNEERQSFMEQSETLQWMQSVERHAQKDLKTQKISNSRLLGIINQQLKQNALKNYPFQLQQTSNSDIQLRFKSVPFTILMIWLWELDRQYDITVHQLSLEKLSVPGTVKANLVLQTAPQ